jgi:ribosomal protein S18 acetylase RimI-like enzyme
MKIRGIQTKDRPRLKAILAAQRHFKAQEVEVALELIDIGLSRPFQKDYTIRCVEEDETGVQGYICYGKAPLTDAVYDLYWIVIHPASWNRGFGSSLLIHAEEDLRRQKARLLLIETSSLPPYESPRAFYQKRGYVEKARVTDYYAAGEHKLIYGKALIFG